MHPLFLSALALSSVPSVPAATDSNAHDWLRLDRELANFSSSLPAAAEGSAPTISGWIKTDITSDSDNDVLGTNLQTVRVTVAGDQGPFKYKLSFDGAKITLVELKDAYASVKVAEGVNLQMGQYKIPFLFSAMCSDELFVFYNRTTQGGLWGGREPGAMVFGNFAQLRYWLSMQNGGDGTADEFLMAAKAAFDVIGKGITKQEAGYGPNAETMVTVSLGLVDEGTIDDGQAMSAEAMAVIGGLWLHGEVVDYGDDYTAGAVLAGSAKKAADAAQGGTTPFSFTAAYQVNDHWEFAGRFEDADDGANDTTRMGAGATYFVMGHKAKWQLNFISADSNNAGLDGDQVTLGLILAY